MEYPKMIYTYGRGSGGVLVNNLEEENRALGITVKDEAQAAGLPYVKEAAEALGEKAAEDNPPVADPGKSDWPYVDVPEDKEVAKKKKKKAQAKADAKVEEAAELQDEEDEEDEEESKKSKKKKR